VDWSVVDAKVRSGRLPGYVGAVRVRGEVSTRAVGVPEDALFRIASLSKPMGAVLTLALIEDGVIALEDPIGEWLPEAAAPRVLRRPDGPLDETVAAVRPITVRHLLTMTAGWGAILAPTPLQREMIARGVFSGAFGHPMPVDEFVRGVCSLPLAFQPGEGWLYDTPMNLLGILLMRLTGRSLTALLGERVFDPLGMRDTAFHGSPTGSCPRTRRPATGWRSPIRPTACSPARRPSRSSTAGSCPPAPTSFASSARSPTASCSRTRHARCWSPTR
jgi:CubicO group peptidase (beta-lactamase class C family)